MLVILIAAQRCARAGARLETAREKQARAALTEMVAQQTAAAVKAPNDAEAQYRAAVTNCYLAEIKIELKDRKTGAQVAEQGIRFGEKAVPLKPENADYQRVLG